MRVPDPSTDMEKCVRALVEARSVVVSTGAGISKESGIPTFRDAPNALWARYDPQTLATREGFAGDPALVWRWYAERRRMISEAAPNAGHVALAELETLLGDVMLLTQNIDDLHRKAGSKDIVEIHGNIFRFKCFDRDHPLETPLGDGVPPRCHCGSFVRPDVVWFGEMLPEAAIDRAYEGLSACDVILVVGTSGMVQPAAGFPLIARRAGAFVIEVNPEETPVTREADVLLRGPAGEMLPALLERLRSSLNREGSHS
ncbi:MAG: NAD-dependent deacetylase [Candidatus Krumholzibacteriia bacterium]